jgi:hypothetical protein
MDRCSTGFKFWRELGLSVRAANILVNLPCETLSDVRRMGMDELLRQHGMGPPTYNEIAKLLDWPILDAPAARRSRLMSVNKAIQSDSDVAVIGYMIQQPKRV